MSDSFSDVSRNFSSQSQNVKRRGGGRGGRGGGFTESNLDSRGSPNH